MGQAEPCPTHFHILYTQSIKRSELFFGLLKIPIDALAVLLAITSAYSLRSASIDLLPGMQLVSGPALLPSFSYYLVQFGVQSTALYIVLLATLGLYALRLTRSGWYELSRVALASVLWLALIVMWYFLVQKQLFFSRLLLLQATMLTTLFVSCGRIGIILLQRLCLRYGYGIRTVVSFGVQPLPESLKYLVMRDRRFQYLGHVKSLTTLKAYDASNAVDLVLQTDPHPNSEDTIHLINHCRNYHIGYSFLPPVFADVPHQLRIEKLGLVPLLTFQPTPLDGWGRVLKRALDLLFGMLLLGIISPLMLFVALLILLIEGRPILYVSHRVGQYGNTIVPLLKFRTMHRNADALKDTLSDKNHRRGPLFKVKDDPRVTRLGKCLRRWSIDELPQLLNVIVGHLSLIGPRPHLSTEVAKYTEDQRRVLAVKPGITGLSQVSGRSDLSFTTEMKLDLRYIEEWSIVLDLWILWRTLIVVLQGKGAD